jgi:hypothetical protein
MLQFVIVLGSIVTLQPEKGNPLARQLFSKLFFDKSLWFVGMLGRKKFDIRVPKNKIKRTDAAK